jgi:hypothetical protein
MAFSLIIIMVTARRGKAESGRLDEDWVMRRGRRERG